MKKFIKGLTIGCMAVLLPLAMKAEPVRAESDIYGWEDDSYDDYSGQEETPAQKDVYEETSWILSDQTIAKGVTQKIELASDLYYDWYTGGYLTPKNVTWKLDGDAAKIKSMGKGGKSVKIKAKSEGEATLTVTYDIEYSSYIERYTSTATIHVSAPKIKQKTIGINKYASDSASVEITGCNEYSSITCTPSSKKIDAYAYYSWWDEKMVLSVSGSKKGNYTVDVNIDGKNFKVKVNVFSAHYTCKASHSVDTWMDKKWHEGETMLALYKGETEQLKIKGLKAGTSVKWTSSNKKVATVNKNGLVKATGNGYCTISAKIAGGSSITYEVGVASKGAIKAVYYAIKHFGSEYSQAQRMSEGKYDCSSYVYRAYRDAGIILGNDRSYAPTAADLAKWCANKGYVIYDETDEVDVTKLLPGDLIFETGENNGRYKGIYHVDLYTGNYSSLTVERTKWYGDKMYNVIIARPTK